MSNSGSAAEANGWVSSSSVKSLSPQGVSATHAATVTIATIRQTGTDILTYEKPTIVSPQFSYYMFALVGYGLNPFVTIGDPNTPILGHSSGIYIAANGLNFGAFDYSPGSRISNSAGVTTIWFSDTMVRCRAPTGRSASDLPLRYPLPVLL